MICPECQRKILPQKDRDGTYSTAYYCQHCRHEHFVLDKVNPGDTTVEFERYRFYIDNTNNRARIEKIYMDIETDTSITYRWYTVLELPSIPQNLNEETVEQKLKLYILFS